MSEILNPLTKRYLKIGSPAYKRLVRSGVLSSVEQPEISQTPPPALGIPNPEAQEFSEKHLQTKLAELSTDMIKDNLKTIVKAQKLSTADLDILIKKMLYEKLCMKPDKPKETKEKKKKKKFKIVEPSSESESESD